MTLWRITEHATLDGAGGLLASARWHFQGRPVVYCAPNPATSLLEVLVHLDIGVEDLLDPLQYLEIEAPDNISIETVSPDSLGLGWQTEQRKTRLIGDQWLGERRTVLLRVPSILVPETWNVLINPQHPQSKKVKIARVHHYSIDTRLLR